MRMQLEPASSIVIFPYAEISLQVLVRPLGLLSAILNFNESDLSCGYSKKGGV